MVSIPNRASKIFVPKMNLCPLALTPFKTMDISYYQGWVPRGTCNLRHTPLNTSNAHRSCDRDGGELSSICSVLQSRLCCVLEWIRLCKGLM